MKPTIGRIVIYKLTHNDAEQINDRRTTRESVSQRIGLTGVPGNPHWPLGAQAHLGSVVRAGDEFPMMIVRVHHALTEVNGQVFLDGNDVLWVISVYEGTADGDWHWPEIVR